jgi:hypothetical protein
MPLYGTRWGINPSIFTDANQGRQYLVENGAGTGVKVLAGTGIKVGEQFKLFEADVDVTALDTGVLTLGTDYFVYAVQQNGGIGFVLSANSTYPSGYSAATSRKIGGFHYGRVRTVAQAYDRNAALAVQVVPNSVWDMVHRPKCDDPTGMAEINKGLWMDIYLSSEDGAAWPNTVPRSRYNATPLTGTELYSYYDYQRLARNAGKRLPTYSEWLQSAWGAPEGASNAGARIATGGVGFALPGGNPSSSQYYFVSSQNIDQPAGNVWQVCADFMDMYNGSTGANGAYAWVAVDQGKSSQAQGSVSQQAFKQLIAGGSWVNGAIAGARCAYLNDAPSNASAYVGLRCVSDSL